MEVITNSSKETQQLAQKIAPFLKGGDIILLKGDLGGGKTTFAQGLALYFKIDTITSPTFVGMQIYKTKSHCEQIKKFCHIDAYRFQSKDDVISSGISEFLGKKDTLTILEWPEQLQNLLEEKTILIEFEHVNPNSRKIIFKDENVFNN